MRKQLLIMLCTCGLSIPTFAMTYVDIKTNKGLIQVELDDQKAPLSTQNFIQYAKSGFYSNTIFHRVIPNFMIQGGGFTKAMVQKPTKDSIQNESSNGLKNLRGTIAMARTNHPHSATSQFFINLKDNHFLDASMMNPGYAVFGKVTKGMDVVDEIAKVKTGISGQHENVPVEHVVIESVTIKETTVKK